MRGGQKRGTASQAEILRLIGFGGLFSIVSEDVALSTEEAEARMCDSAGVVGRSLSGRENWRMGAGGK